MKEFFTYVFDRIPNFEQQKQSLLVTHCLQIF